MNTATRGPIPSFVTEQERTEMWDNAKSGQVLIHYAGRGGYLPKRVRQHEFGYLNHKGGFTLYEGLTEMHSYGGYEGATLEVLFRIDGWFAGTACEDNDGSFFYFRDNNPSVGGVFFPNYEILRGCLEAHFCAKGVS